MNIPLDTIIQWLIHYRYFLLFPAAVIEGPIVTILAGFLASLDYFNLIVAYIIVVLADNVGDSLYYIIGRWGGRRFIDGWGRYLGISPERVVKIENHFENHPGKTLIIGKLTQVASFPTLVASGIANMPFKKFLWYTAIATMIKSFLLLVIGYFFGTAYATIDKYLNYGTEGATIAVVALILIYLIISKFIRKENSPE